MIRIAPNVWPETIRALQRCGAHDVECAVYWTSSIAESDAVDEVIHPIHRSTAFHYEIESGWLHQFFVELHRRGRTVRAQVHSHARAAFHSETDDQWPIVHAPGLLSLVVPNFARGPFSADDLFLAELTDGGWVERPPLDAIGGLRCPAI